MAPFLFRALFIISQFSLLPKELVCVQPARTNGNPYPSGASSVCELHEGRDHMRLQLCCDRGACSSAWHVVGRCSVNIY